MSDDDRVDLLIEEILDSGSSAEQVCRDSPELLARVLEGWRRVRTTSAQLRELFPEPTLTAGSGSAPRSRGGGALPAVDGYEIIDVLGRGGVGVVYKAVHVRLNRTVALKMLLAGAGATRAERQRFAREAEVVAGLRHPNIVQIYDVGDLDGQPYFTMEFVEGGNLDQRLAGTPLPASQGAELLSTLVAAVAEAHRGGIVHRDLKPSNILLGTDGTLKVSDFGLARWLDTGPSVTESGAVVGTPSYMAPEQARGKAQEIGPAADLYALGAILYEMLTGRPPFRAETASETMLQVIHQDPVPPSRLNAKVPRDLETICLKCLGKEPQRRYSDAPALAEDLRRFLRGEPIAAHRVNGLQRFARRARRRPVLSAAIACGSLALAGMAGGGLWLISEQQAGARRAEADRAAMERAADEDLREMVRCEEKSSWAEAGAALERAKGRSGDRGSDALRRRLDRGASELALVKRLDAIRLEAAASIGGTIKFDRLIGPYQSAFEEAGLGKLADSPEVVAARIRLSSVRGALVAMLDDWASHAGDVRRRDWLLNAARLADDDPTGWSDLARRPETWADRAKLAGVLAASPVADQSVPLMLALANHAKAIGEDAIPFLARVQGAHPGDFWANLALGDAFREKKDFGQAARFYQAALAVHPDLAIVRGFLGETLWALGRGEEAMEHYRRVVQLDPTAAGHHNLARRAMILGRNQEAAEQARIAIRMDPLLYHPACAACSQPEARGWLDEAIEAQRGAVALEPGSSVAQARLRGALICRGRFEEARAAWAKALETNPRDHLARDGYSEFCLFLGRAEEYRRSSRTLLDGVDATKDPRLIERLARAWLLAPLTPGEAGEAVALIDGILADEKSHGPTWLLPYFLFAKGLAEYRLGRFEAAASFLDGRASGVLGPAPGLVLAMAQHQLGRVDRAQETLSKALLGFDWEISRAIDREAWMYHILRREAEGMIRPGRPTETSRG